MMKKLWALAVIAGLVLFVAGGVFAQEDVKKISNCPYCGMDRAKFAHSRVLIEYEDGTAEGTCSIHCLAVEMALKIDKTLKTVWVGDVNTKKLVDVEKASWVLGGSKPGVMTKRAKWAFEKKEDADRFIKENGGTPVNFDQAIKASYEDMYADTQMIRERRKMKRMQHK